MSTSVLPFQREGAWVSSHYPYYNFAYDSYEGYITVLGELDKAEKEISISLDQKYADDADGIVFHETLSLRNTAYRHAEASFMYICMSIEAFIIYYGIKRLGNTYYKRNIEKLSIKDKIKRIFDECEGVKLNNSHTLIVNIGNIFNRRNKLVHPKAKMVTPQNIHEVVVLHPRDLKLKEDLQIFEVIINEICNIDHDINRQMEFSRWNYSNS